MALPVGVAYAGVASNESVPRRRRGEDLAESLGENGKPAGWDMSVFLRAHHLLDGPALVGGELLRSGLWTRGHVVEIALLVTPPRVVPRRRQTEDAECCPKGERRSRSLRGTKDSALLIAIGNTATSERYFGHPHQGDEDAQHGEKLGVSLLKFEDFRS